VLANTCETARRILETAQLELSGYAGVGVDSVVSRRELEAALARTTAAAYASEFNAEAMLPRGRVGESIATGLEPSLRARRTRWRQAVQLPDASWETRFLEQPCTCADVLETETGDVHACQVRGPSVACLPHVATAPPSLLSLLFSPPYQ
jgi:hypothetical protein